MKKTAAWLSRYALEQLGIQHTLGIPGVHNTELYDELKSSESITPILVSHEGGASFMADGISRTSEQVGCLVIVPAAGLTHAASGIGEAFLDGVPMLIISGGIRRDSDYGYQLHEIDQQQILAGMTKANFLVASHREVLDTIYKAYHIATTGEPGPVFIEIPINLQLDKGQVDQLLSYTDWIAAQRESLIAPVIDGQNLEQAIELLKHAQRPGIFVGWGGRHAASAIADLAEHLGAPVATTLQGLSAFPANHPLHVGFSFGEAAVPAATEAFKDCDCLLAVGTRFAEIATASYGVNVPEKLIHVDINPKVFSRNYPASVTLLGDAAEVVPRLRDGVLAACEPTPSDELRLQIARNKQEYREEWYAHDSGDRVNPARFFDFLRLNLSDDGIVVLDDGNHTFLAAELMPIHRIGGLISPTDFNAMGYAIPAAIGAKMANPDTEVVSVVGDGAFMMTCMELSTAVKNGYSGAHFIFNDGQLSQIAQAQDRPYNRNTCTDLPVIDYRALAQALGCEYLCIRNDDHIEEQIMRAMGFINQGQTVIVNVLIDYSKPTRFTEGVVKTNIDRLPMNTKVRMVSRALYRKVKKPD